MKAARLIRIVGASGVFLVGTTLGFLTVTMATAGEERFRPAGPGEATYQLSSFRITYPYVEQSAAGDVAEDRSRAGVTFDVSWSSSEYPGEATCLISLRDGQGSIVGEATVNLDSLQPTVAMRSQVPVPVTAPPASAAGECEAGYYPKEGDYTIEAQRISAAEGGGTQVDVIVRWVDGNHPGTRICKANATLLDGTLVTHRFTLDAPDGAAFPVILPTDPAGVADIWFECTRFVG